MRQQKPTPGRHSRKNTALSLARSSAAEYLTFVAASGQGGVEAVYADENVWLTQKMMGTLYDVETHTINYHLKKVFLDSELQEDSVIRNFRITAADGKTYDTQHYNLAAIIAVGYKVNSERAVQFRKWASGIIESFTHIVVDGGGVKIGDFLVEFAFAQADFADALELLLEVFFSKNGAVVFQTFIIHHKAFAYLDLAEDMAIRQIPMTMQDWETRLNRFIAATDREILQDAGKVTAVIAQAHAESEFEKYRVIQDRLFESDFDRALKNLPGKSSLP